MHRLFVPKDQLPHITGSDAHYVKNVLRLKVGDELELLDGTGATYLAKIMEIKKDRIVCEVIESRKSKIENGIRITLAQCLPKAKKMDLIIQKCTELGVHKIIPTLSERSIAKADKLERWQKIAKEAAEQSGGTTISEIAPLTKFKDVIKTAKDYDLALIPWEMEKEKTLKQSLISRYPDPHSPIPGSPDILILIGPEGGFSSEEVNQAKSAGFTPISLGKRILRTETAGMAILSMINYEYEA